jgi:CBS domain-containing protein
MKVADVMTSELVTCREDDSLNRAAQLMWERRCGTVVVVNDAGRAVGLLTDRDIAMAAYTQGRRLDDIAVTTAMSRAVRTCPASAAVEDAEDIMAAQAVRRVVVIGDDGRPSGLLSIDDIAQAGAEWDGKGDIDLEQVALTLGEISRRSAGIDDDGPEGQTAETDLNDIVHNSLSALRTLRDEIRVDLNLAGKEVRDRWRRLESRLRAAETHAHDGRDDAARNLIGVVNSAKQFRARLREKTSQPASQRR